MRLVRVRLLLLAALFIGGTWGPVSARAAPPVIEAGRERDVLALIAPFRDEGPVTADVKLAGIQIRGDRVVFALLYPGPPPQRAQVQLRPIEALEAGPASESFTLELPSDAPAPLLEAARALARAIRANDDGTFFSAPPPPQPVTAVARPTHTPRPDERNPVIPLELQDGDFDLWRTPAALVAIAGWLLLCAALLASAWTTWRAWWPPHRRLALMLRLAVLALAFSAALLARRSAPLTPLHANDHAWDDVAVALDLPDSAIRTQRYVVSYGSAWLVAQRAGTAVFGRHFDGLGAAAAAWGATAVALTLAAAWGAGGTSWAAVLAAMAMVLAPVALRVGHSESPLVIGQFLVAAALWLATRRGRLARIGLVATVYLLARGHAVGPALAGSVAVMAWGLSRPPATWRDRVPDWRRAIGWGALLVGVSVLGLLLHLQGAAGQVADRMGSTEGWVPIPGNLASFSLWFDPTWAPLALLPLALIGALALLALARPWQLRHAGLWPMAVLGGAIALKAAGQLVCACVTDGLRYQATWAPAVVLLAAFSPQLSDALPSAARWPTRTVVWLGAALLLASLLRPMAGVTLQDAQGQAWDQLRAQLDGERGDLYMVVPDRMGPRAAVPQVPEGPWSAAGPTVHAVLAETVRFECAAGLPLRQPLWIWLPPACASGDHRRAARVCGQIEDLKRPGGPAFSGAVRPLRPASPTGIPGEFLSFTVDVAPWRLARGGCPPAGAPP